MKIAEIKVAKTTCETTQLVPIPKGIVGATVSIEYMDSAWDGLQKTVVFRSAVTKDVLSSGNEVVIPAEVVSRAGRNLYIGVYGVNTENNVVIPIIWANLGTIWDAANPSGDTTTDPALPVWAQIQGMIGNLDELDTEMKNDIVAAVNEALAKGVAVDEAEIRRIVADYLYANPPTVEETDPTVPAWAKQPTKPTYTAEEVHALPDTYIPPNQTAQQVGADPAGTAASAVSQHNTDTAAHNDLRLALQELSNRVNAALDSDDVTLDQMSEVVAYIKSNKILIDAITTSKISVSDIVNDLVTNVSDKPLSAAQGVALKKLIDDLQAMIPEGGSGIAVSGATVGQTVKIAAVDENGVPTAWEPVDFPSGGGGEADPPLLVDYTVPDDSTASIIEFTSDDNGIAFNLNNRCYFVVDAIFPDSTSKNIGIVSNGVNQGAGPFSPGNLSVTVTELHIFGKYTRDFGTRYTTWVQYRPNVNYGYPTSSYNQFGRSDLALLMEHTRGTAVKSLRFVAMGTGDTIYWAPGTRVRIWGD